MTGFNTQEGEDIGFHLQFQTDDREKFLFMQEQARKCLDNKYKAGSSDENQNTEEYPHTQRDYLEIIYGLADDYDGYRDAKNLMSLIDEIKDFALKGMLLDTTNKETES